MKKPKFEKITNVRLPFDMRSDDPGKNYGIHGMDIWYILKGSLGAVQFAFTVPCYLPHVKEELIAKNDGYWEKYCQDIQGFDLGYHAKKKQYKGQLSMTCEMFGKCYYDGSSLQADEWAKQIFAIRGENPAEEIWRRLEEEYHIRFKTKK